MTVCDLDIWRSASLLMKRHGVGAGTVAAQRADELLASGDLDGQAVWKRILAAIETWQREGHAPGERTN